MILQDLLNIDGCPQRGVSVTVYGIPWKAMLTFGVAAGPVRNKAELVRFFEAIVERLQRLYGNSPVMVRLLDGAANLYRVEPLNSSHLHGVVCQCKSRNRARFTRCSNKLRLGRSLHVCTTFASPDGFL
jgi:hypothetical protein